MIADLIHAYAVWFVGAAIACLTFVAGWNHYRSFL